MCLPGTINDMICMHAHRYPSDPQQDGNSSFYAGSFELITVCDNWSEISLSGFHDESLNKITSPLDRKMIVHSE